MQDEPVMRVLLILPGYGFEQFQFHLQRRFALCQPGPVRYAEDVCVDRDRGFAKGGIEHNICCFSAHAGQGFQ